VIVEELLPLIDRKYRTIPERSFRAVGGLSRGAGWSVHLALNYWQLFGALGAHSPAIFFEDAQHMRPLLDAIPKDAYPRIYIDIGDKDRPEIVQAANWFEQLLNERDIPHEWHMFSGYHEEAYWKSHVTEYLLWYASQW
jgi:enterochelin esterase-like enzyme